MIASLTRLAQERRVILDGGLGSQILKRKPTIDDFGGPAFEGCLELLCERRPQWIQSIHEAYFQAGADAVETNSFGCNALVLKEFGLEQRAFELARAAGQLARDTARSFHTPKFVLGSVGPGTKLLTLGQVSYSEMYQAYRTQMEGLLAGGVDALLIETCQDLGQVKLAVRAAHEAMKSAGRRAEVWAQVTIEASGTMLLGSNMAAAVTTLASLPLDVLGINCATGPKEMGAPLHALFEGSPRPISCLPNAGLPEVHEGNVVYRLGPDDFAAQLCQLAERYGISFLGGCCGTTPDHIRSLTQAAAKLPPAPQRPSTTSPAVSSLYESLPLDDKGPYYIGERTNANGSKKFRDLLERDDYEGLVEVAREQEREGAHLLDVCVACVGRNEKRDMEEFLKRLVVQVRLPLVIDSTNPEVIEAALRIAPGKCVVNSINLEDGEERPRQVLELCRTYGAAVIGLTIDESGMAKGVNEKLQIAQRIIDLAHREYGLPLHDIWLDPLTFTLASGEAEYRNSASETLSAIEKIKTQWPEVRTLLGVSNISFGLAPQLRPLLNSVMLFEAGNRGLDFAIAHSGKILPVANIQQEKLSVIRDLIHNRRSEDWDPLKAMLAWDCKASAAGPANDTHLSIEERLKNDIIQGRRRAIPDSVKAALESYPPLQIINELLLDAMKTVGERFGKGEMQLPFVLESAEAMKCAVGLLEPHLGQSGSTFQKGALLLATVKGDVHDIGKNLVDIILTNNGFEVENLGVKISSDELIAALRQAGADRYTALGLSGLLVKSTLIMKEYLEIFEREGLSIPVILGGAALTRRFVEEECQKAYSAPVFYAADAFEGLNLMNGLAQKDWRSLDLDALRRSARGEGQEPDDAVIEVVHEEGKVTLNSLGQSSWIRHEGEIPKPPFWGTQELSLKPETIFDWLDRFSVVRGQWKLSEGPEAEQHLDRLRTALLAGEIPWRPRALYGYFRAESQGNRLRILDGIHGKDIAQIDLPRQPRGRRLCIADFFRSGETGEPDTLALQVVTLGHEVQDYLRNLFSTNEYSNYFLTHGLLTELTEAMAEALHAHIRRELGIHEKDGATKRKIFAQGYQGSRYSFGYPACPDLSGNQTLLELLGAERIGVTLSESQQFQPELTTAALVAWHPQARYFNV